VKVKERENINYISNHLSMESRVYYHKQWKGDERERRLQGKRLRYLIDEEF
jgi:hypothetical protein